MPLPLYSFNSTVLTSSETANPGLVFEKFIDGWAKNWNEKVPHGNKRAFYDATAQRSYTFLSDGLEAANARQKKLVESLGGRLVPAETDWRFVSGLGNSHPFEAGFIWHRILGAPYLPGSSVKGLIRAWADPWSGWGDSTRWEEIKRLFGDTDTDGVGSIVVFDALPRTVPRLEVDIMNPHYGPYYQDPKRNPPADYYSPVPIFFLTVAPNEKFCFSIAPRPRAYQPCEEKAKEMDLDKSVEFLTEALSTLGAGGKTAVGYGVFRTGRSQSKDAGLKAVRETWQDATLRWNKGNRTLTGSSVEPRRTAQVRLLQDLSIFGNLDVGQRRKLLDKGKPIKASVVVEHVGNAFRIVGINTQKQ